MGDWCLDQSITARDEWPKPYLYYERALQHTHLHARTFMKRDSSCMHKAFSFAEGLLFSFSRAKESHFSRNKPEISSTKKPNPCCKKALSLPKKSPTAN